MSDAQERGMCGWLSTLLLALMVALLAYQTFRPEPQWVYQFKTLGTSDESGKTLLKQVNELAQVGWRLDAVDFVAWGTDDDTPTIIRAALKRRR